MRTSAFRCVALALAAGLLLVATDVGAERPADRNPDFTVKPPSPEKMQEGMALWMEMGNPGIYHERLAYFVGEWEITTKIWMQGPGAPPQESRGTASYRWMMDGRWLAQEMTGEMMSMPVTGFGLTGYDNYRREYVGIWIDNTSTVLSTSSGRLDASGRILTLYGEMDEPMTGDLGKMVAYITRIVEDDTHVFEIHDLGIGGEQTKVLEIIYTRK